MQSLPEQRLPPPLFRHPLLMQPYVRVPLCIQSDRYENIAAYRRDNAVYCSPAAVWLVTVTHTVCHHIATRRCYEGSRSDQRIRRSWNDHNRDME